MSGDENSAVKEVDIDELEIRVFMLVKNTASMQSSVSFLTRRGWETVCQTNISKAIDTIVKSTPEIVMVSVNHPNPNVLRLPQLLSQSMNTITIGFAESPDSISSRKLKQSKFQHKFSGYPSGPSFHRFIRQILDRTYNAHKYEEKQSKNRNKKAKGSGDDQVEVKGSRSSDSDNMTFSNSKQSGTVSVKGGSDSELLSKQTSKDSNPVIQAGPERLGSDGTRADQRDLKAQSWDDLARQQEEFLKNSDGQGANSGNVATAGLEDEDSLTPSGGRVAKRTQGSGSFDEVDEQGFKRKKKPPRKRYPWQKSEDPKPDPIKDHENRPGASFEMKQSRKDGSGGDEDKEKKDLAETDGESDFQKGKGKDSPELEAESKDQSSGADFNYNSPKDKKSGDFSDDSSEGKGFDEASSGSSKDRNANQGSDDSDGFSKKANEDSLNSEDSSNKKDANEEPGFDSKKNPDSAAGLAEGKHKQKLAPDRDDAVPGRELQESEDKFRRLMKEALKNATEEADPNVKIEIDEVEKIGVIPLNSSVLSGYVVVSRSGIGFDLGVDLLESLLQKIESTMSTHGISVHCQRPFVMHTEKFNFEFWKKNVGLFTIFEQSQREEIALTFLQTDVAVPEMRISEHDPEMIKIEVGDIETDAAVNFNTYIYLEKNKRFYKYINDGRKILDRQKEKLGKSKKTREFHIARSDYQAFQQYFAKNMIQSLLDALSTDIDLEEKKTA